ncbi:Alpha-ketoglutarate-dependent dioxygenase AlkB-like [Dillenia turbinata]|uniref:Alpha-ketoglutarate-dependent dioxygenase AlkB-like n=1 Tax=Dillenia turbinata TaxID=194707 RepID=A0AAN8ZKE9_9MAGN
MEDEGTLKEVFGESSDDESKAIDNSVNGGQIQNPRWERIKEISGLCLCRDFLSPDQQSSLLSCIQNEGWLDGGCHNQAMRFGDLPTWAIRLANSIREAVYFSDCLSQPIGGETSNEVAEDCYFPAALLWREPFFDQLILNVYQPGEGICAHVDLMRFEDGIAIVSLESSCVMHFIRVESDVDGNEQEGKKIPLHLTPGSLVLMWGEARYLWKHEINRNPGFQFWQGEEIQQKRRTSITLRKLCNTE